MMGEDGSQGGCPMPRQKWGDCAEEPGIAKAGIILAQAGCGTI